MSLIHYWIHVTHCWIQITGFGCTKSPARNYGLLPVGLRHRTLTSLRREGWTEEQPLDKLDNPFAVEVLALAVLECKALLEGGTHEIIEQLGVRRRRKWRQLSLGDQPLKVDIQGIRNLLFGHAQT